MYAIRSYYDGEPRGLGGRHDVELEALRHLVDAVEVGAEADVVDTVVSLRIMYAIRSYYGSLPFTRP